MENKEGNEKDNREEDSFNQKNHQNLPLQNKIAWENKAMQRKITIKYLV